MRLPPREASPMKRCLLVLALCAVFCALPASAELFHVTLTNGSVIDTAYQPQQASWDPNMVLLLADTGNWIGLQRDEIDTIQAEDPAQGFGVRISKNVIALGFSPNDQPVPEEGNARQAGNDKFFELAERALALAEKQQNYSVQQGVSTESTQGIPTSFGYFGSPSGNSGGVSVGSGLLTGGGFANGGNSGGVSGPEPSAPRDVLPAPTSDPDGQ